MSHITWRRADECPQVALVVCDSKEGRAARKSIALAPGRLLGARASYLYSQVSPLAGLRVGDNGQRERRRA